jgi:hypothetical protein
MNLNPADVLNPVINFLDALIANYGVYLYLVFVWLSLGAIAWVLGGGLRRKRPQGNSVTVIPGIIITIRPPMHQPPPFIIAEVDVTPERPSWRPCTLPRVLPPCC